MMRPDAVHPGHLRVPRKGYTHCGRIVTGCVRHSAIGLRSCSSASPLMFPGATAAARRQKAGVLMASRVLADSEQCDKLLEGARQFFATRFAEV
jgi:hypothetical protein